MTDYSINWSRETGETKSSEELRLKELSEIANKQALDRFYGGSIQNMKTALDIIYNFGIHHALSDISMWAYSQDCPGLSQEECSTLESLCDKARRGIERVVGDTLGLKGEIG